uniref:Uncharacterized protein n=1 Tax=Panagrolaimus sp. PS1159 TaxID=55785 RepID=A0AC35G330_9BILA
MKSPTVSKKDITIGMAYAGKFSDGFLRRCVVKDIQEKTVKAFFVDVHTGNYVENVPMDSIRYLQNELAEKEPGIIIPEIEFKVAKK